MHVVLERLWQETHILASDLEGMKVLLGGGAALIGCGSGTLENESSSSSNGVTCT